MNNRLAGMAGEAFAAEYLKKDGHRILCNNYRCRVGEIDIISQKGKEIIFSEVKLRKNDVFAEAKEHVTPAKQRRIRKAALYWLSLNNKDDFQPRFDVIEIYAPKGIMGKVVINVLENAFE